MDRPPPPKPPAPRRRVPSEESADVAEGGGTPLEVLPGTPPEALGSNEDPRPWARRVRRRAERPSEPATPVDLVLRSVSRSASPMNDVLDCNFDGSFAYRARSQSVGWRKALTKILDSSSCLRLGRRLPSGNEPSHSNLRAAMSTDSSKALTSTN